MSTLTATPATQQTGKPVQLQYTGGLGGSLRLTRPNGSRYYLPTTPGTGSKTYTPTTVGQHKADLFTKKNPKVIASAAFGVTSIPVTPPAPPPPANAVRVAVEGGSYLSTGSVIWYGAGTKWATRSFAAGTIVQCINAQFGDPIPNTRKECRAVVPPGPLAAVAGDRWVDLAWQT